MVKQKASPKLLKKIRKLREEANQISPQNMGDAYNVQGLKDTIADYARTGSYEPGVLKAIEKEVEKRKKWELAALEQEKKDRKRIGRLRGDDVIFTDRKGKEWTISFLKELVEAGRKFASAQRTFEYYFD